MSESLHTGNANTDEAVFQTVRELGTFPVVARFTISGEPSSKARPRFTVTKTGKARTYPDQKTAVAEQKVAWSFRAAAKPGYRPDPEEKFGVVALFFSNTRQRRDVDNMLKLVLDGLNEVAWADDSQVSEVSGRKCFDPNQGTARTEVLVYQIGPSDAPSAVCPNCGTSFKTYRSRKKTTHCSAQCAIETRTKKLARTCEQCAEPFTAPKSTSTQRFCSKECANKSGMTTVQCTTCGSTITRRKSSVGTDHFCGEPCAQKHYRALRKAAGTGPGTCVDCAGPVTRKEYTRCRPCARLHQARTLHITPLTEEPTP